jgi:ubiquinone/menaquinone biosynthesis C-methylase UbiE
MSKPLTDIQAETERVRAIQDKQAPRYDRQISFFERILFADGREWATSQAQGEVLEIAVGTGRNLEHYRPGTRLTGIELSAEMLAIARERAADAQIEVELRQGDAQALDFDDQTFDTVVITLALCTIPDDRKAAAEAYRVLRPGGRLVLLEHVRSPVTAVRIGQRILQPLALRFEADNLVREPLDYLTEVGFEIESVERLKWGIVERTVARKPEGPPASGEAAPT